MSDKNLFPVFDVPDFIEDEIKSGGTVKKSIYWDSKTGDFARDGANRLIQSNGTDTYKQWCQKIVYTERFALMSYPDEIGVEMEEAQKQQTRKAVESCVERTITEALLVNEQTEYVRDFNFEWDSDCLFCEFSVKGEEQDEFVLNVDIKKGGE